MDESFTDLENELRALQPRRPSVLLRSRVAAGLDPTRPAASADRGRYTSATSLRTWKWLNWQTACAAAGVALALATGLWLGGRVDRGTESQAPSMAAGPAARPAGEASQEAPAAGLAEQGRGGLYRPVSASSVLYDLRDEGTVVLEDDRTARQARYRFVDSYTWRNPATNASLRVSVPRDEVRVLPVRLN